MAPLLIWNPKYAIASSWNTPANCLHADPQFIVHNSNTIGSCPWKREWDGTFDAAQTLPSLWPSGIGSRLEQNRLWVRFLAVSDIYPMFIEPMITWVPSGFSGTYGSTQKLCSKKNYTPPSNEVHQNVWVHITLLTFTGILIGYIQLIIIIPPPPEVVFCSQSQYYFRWK